MEQNIEFIDTTDYGTEVFENIVFLDIDGVMNHHKMECSYRFLSESVEALNELYQTHQIQIVLSSSWKNAYSFAFLQKLFRDNGINAPLIDKTFTFFSNKEEKKCFTLAELQEEQEDIRYSREYEIYHWIEVFRPKHYLILDDYQMKQFSLEEHQILTSYWDVDESNMAFRKKHLNECRRILSI